jgi:hypothetical protein
LGAELRDNAFVLVDGLNRSEKAPLLRRAQKWATPRTAKGYGNGQTQRLDASTMNGEGQGAIRPERKGEKNEGFFAALRMTA